MLPDQISGCHRALRASFPLSPRLPAVTGGTLQNRRWLYAARLSVCANFIHELFHAANVGINSHDGK